MISVNYAAHTVKNKRSMELRTRPDPLVELELFVYVHIVC